MNKASSIIITLALVIGLGIIFTGGSKSKNPDAASAEPVQNVEIREGVQYVTINAKGGYLPEVSNAKAGVPTKLVVKTDGTYDCSSTLVINSLDFRKTLPQTGETEIDIGTKNVGETLQGVCGMGMYNFEINFS